MLPEHFSQEEWDKESEYLAKCQPTIKTGGSGHHEMMKPYYDWLEKQGEPLPIPTHSFELTKAARQKAYEQKLSEYEISRRNNGFEHTGNDVAQFRLLWLGKELLIVEGWIHETDSRREQRWHKEVDIDSDRAEQSKYKNYIESEIKALEVRIRTSDTANTNTTEQGLSQSELALYWVYLHDTGSEPDFTKHPRGKVEAIKELLQDRSWKSFQQHYNSFIDYKKRTGTGNITRIEAILPLLVKYPRAHFKAMDELRVAKSR